MGRMKDLALDIEECERHLVEEIAAKKREYREEEMQERKERQEEFDFERDCGARA